MRRTRRLAEPSDDHHYQMTWMTAAATSAVPFTEDYTTPPCCIITINSLSTSRLDRPSRLSLAPPRSEELKSFPRRRRLESRSGGYSIIRLWGYFCWLIIGSLHASSAASAWEASGGGGGGRRRAHRLFGWHPRLLDSRLATASSLKRRVLSPHIMFLRGGGRGEQLRTEAAASHSRGTAKIPSQESSSSSSLSSSSSSSSASTDHQPDSAEKDDPRIIALIRWLFLAYYGSLGSLMPYLPVYYESIGHGGNIIGLLGAVKPATTFLVAPLWGLLADRTQRPFLILQVTFLVSLVGQLLVAVSHHAYIIMGWVFLTALFNAPVKSLMDSMVLDQIKDRTSYGRLRLWGQMGFGLGSSAVGMMLSHSPPVPWPVDDNFSEAFAQRLTQLPAWIQRGVQFLDKSWRSLSGYKLLFVSYAALSLPTWILLQSFHRMHLAQQKQNQLKEPQQEQAAATAHSTGKKEKSKSSADPSESKEAVASEKDGGSMIGKGLWLLLHNADAMFFFFLVLVVGLSSGVIENFAYVRLREVGGTGKEMGLSRLVSSLAGAPMFWYSGPLSKALGVDRVLVVSLLSYVTRFVIYALQRRPYQGLPAEALRGITFAAFWSSATIYAHRISPPGLHATMLMFLNAMYGGLGQSLGAIIGGKLQERFGTVRTFLYSAAVDLGLVGLVVVYLSLRKNSSFRNPQPIGVKEKEE